MFRFHQIFFFNFDVREFKNQISFKNLLLKRKYMLYIFIVQCVQILIVD